MKSLFAQSLRYLGYLLKAKTAHGIHSPYVYQLITDVIYNKSSYYIYGPAEAQRRRLMEDRSTIDVEDFGAGSKFNRSRKRRISSIARNSLKSKKYAQLIFRLAESRRPRRILELGTSLGLTTVYLSYACPDAEIFSIEGSQSISSVAFKLQEKFKCKNINLITGKFEAMLPKLISEQKPFDFVFIDGHHDERATLNYFNLLVESCSEEALLIFDDINWSDGMQRAWQKIKEHEKVTLSIDLFEMGLIYLMPRNQKEHFVIRF